ncbi:uncharacterized protein PRCAT00001261001 [Priceomyces carsonii]|uniref:uncharacterized protein n=1 Tax=Priceomyces carsonii TaxID=28549 RepID=UPI002EDAAE96|nr:unnamed protein product [Priceomyces carsonii]
MTCSAADCVCAKKSTCSCGSKPAMQCTCEKAAQENKTPAPDNACACGMRNKGKCTCGVTEGCQEREGEVDYTHLK